MPSALTYPGVYIEEIPSGVRTITGVATSITAFLGRTRRGQTNVPVTISSFGDFERVFGGLHVDYPLSYAVRDFFVNGGSQAIVVRVVHANVDAALADKMLGSARSVVDAMTGAATVAAAKTAADTKNTAIQGDATKSTEEKAAAKAVTDAIDAAAATAATVDELQTAGGRALAGATASKAAITLPTSGAGLVLEAADPGEWGNDLSARVDREDITDAVAERFKPLTKDQLFNLTLANTRTRTTERFLNLTNEDAPRRVDRVLESESSLMRVRGTPPGGAAPTVQADPVLVAPADQGLDGGHVDRSDLTVSGLQAGKRGLYALDKADLFNLLCIPADTRSGDTAVEVYQDALPYCVLRRAMLVVDSPAAWKGDTAVAKAVDGLPALGLAGPDARNAALYFPRVRQSDPLQSSQIDTFVPCGLIAGIMARTDTTRGVWKAPAGLDATINGVQALEVNLNDPENGILNPLGINCLRFFPASGRVVWGARTLRGADRSADEYKYVPVRRTALFIEESLYRGLQWVVFEPNDEPLWAQIRLNVGAFMQNLFRQGAFQGTTPRDAYFVKCDKETTTQTDINLGIVNILVGFAPLKPAEFVVVKLQQMAGQIPT